mgnify:CR=1 FL=1|tara:strand:+ start:6029 stop:6604 length:576 start_codon:yes stop_codon:yes gene_type:complete
MRKLQLIAENINEHLTTLNTIKDKDLKNILKFYNIILASIKKKGTIFWCGNGGSASDSQHLAAELIGRYKSNRKPLKSISLNSDTSVLTCISNDFGYENIFSRQLEGIANQNDVLIIISTSGNSKNIINAVKFAKKKKIKVLGLLGKNGGVCKNLIKNKIIINSNNTARIQEMHIMIGHVICDLIEEQFGI